MDPRRRPNVIVVLTDQQRWDTTGVHGNPLGLTPTFDEMARAGAHFAQAMTPNPVCAPARASLQTGQYGTTSGVYRNGVPLPADARTLAHHLGGAGYTTGYIGKWHLGDVDPVPTEQRGGYQHWLAANLLEFTSDAYHTVVFDEDEQAVMLPGYRSDAIFDAVIRFAADHSPLEGEAEDRSPFFLFCSLLEPHQQNDVDAHPAPAGYAERYTGRWMPPDLGASDAADANALQHLGGYCGQVRRVDEGLGRLLDALRSMDLLEETIIAFTSDHGNHFRTRNAQYKRSCHDSSIRVPFAMTGPGFTGGGRVDRPVSTIDLAPTLLDAVGLDVPPEMEGHSMVPLLRGDASGYPAEAFIQVSESELGRSLRTTRWKYHVVAPDADPWNEVSSSRYVEAELYDLLNDPYELRNLAGSAAHRPIADDLRDRLFARMVAAGEPAPVIEAAPERPTPLEHIDARVHQAEWTLTRYGHQQPHVARERATPAGR